MQWALNPCLATPSRLPSLLLSPCSSRAIAWPTAVFCCCLLCPPAREPMRWGDLGDGLSTTAGRSSASAPMPLQLLNATKEQTGEPSLSHLGSGFNRWVVQMAVPDLDFVTAQIAESLLKQIAALALIGPLLALVLDDTWVPLPTTFPAAGKSRTFVKLRQPALASEYASAGSDCSGIQNPCRCPSSLTRTV